MAKVTFIDPQGERHTVEAANGTSIMEAAVNNSIAGVYAECGGTCSCATCHCYVDTAWESKLQPMSDLEDGMLDGSNSRRSNSRLTCQIIVDESLDGIVLEVADNNV